METTQQNWYVGKLAGDHQGVIVEEGTGRSVAVAYDKADAPLLAAAPELLAALTLVMEESDGGWRRNSPTARAVLAAIQAAKGK